MAKRKRSNFKSIVLVVLAFIIAGSAYGVKEYSYNPDVDLSEITVHFIDVGQGCSTLIQSGNRAVLIDAGESDRGVNVCNYINNCGVNELLYVIATHPHSDHIGGMSKVLNGYKCGTLYAPELPDELVPATNTYNRFLDAITDNAVTAKYAEPGTKFTFADAVFEFYAPVKDIDSLNNMSLVVKMTYGNTSLLFAGDAEKEELSSICQKDYDLKSDIYLATHHGSRTGLNTAFLEMVSPSVAIISCGLNNDYGHPHEQTLKYYNNKGIKLYRTDTDGSITVTIDENGYNITTEK